VYAAVAVVPSSTVCWWCSGGILLLLLMLVPPLLLGWACSRNTVQCEMFGLLFMLVNKYLRISDPNLIPTGGRGGGGVGGGISLYLLRMCTNGLN
jgi:hypothetical protein